MTDTVLVRKEGRTPPDPRVWTVRLLFAACLAFASEVVLWTDVTRPVWMWVPVALGYVAVAALLLDLLVRYRVHELFGAMALMGLYGLCAGLLLNPAVSLEALPEQIVTRVMGTQTVAGFLGLGLLVALLAPSRARLVGSLAPVLGLAWGVWVRGYQMRSGDAPVTTTTLIVAAVGGVLLIVLLWVLAARLPPSDAAPDAMRLRTSEAAGVAVVFVVLFGLGVWQGTISRNAISIITVIAVYILLMLWFQMQQTPMSLLDGRLPVRFGGVLPVMVGALLFVVAGAFSYQLPPPDPDAELAPFTLLTLFFLVIGAVWLPAVSIVMGVRAYRQTVRTGKLL